METHMPGASKLCDSAAAASSLPSAQQQRQPAASTPGRHDSKVNHDVAEQEQEQDGSIDVDDSTAALATASAALRHNRNASVENATRPTTPSMLNTLISQSVHTTPERTTRHSSPASAGLHVDVSIVDQHPPSYLKETPTIYETPVESLSRPSYTSPIAIANMGSSLRSNLSADSIAYSLSPGSTASALTSPYLNAMTDITPLPSPVMPTDGQASWKRPRGGSGLSARPSSLEDTGRPGRASSLSSSTASGTSPRKKTYGSLVPSSLKQAMAEAQERPQEQTHGRNRSISDFVPEALQNVRQRNVTIGAGDIANSEYTMHREAHLAAQRGLTSSSDASKALPSPPASNTSIAEDDEAAADDEQTALMENGEPAEYLYIHCGIQNRKRRFRQLRHLGRGTFSKVMLATSERVPANPPADIEQRLAPHRLVAVKIVEHGPAGGADEERIEISLRREVEMLKSVSHPSLIHLKACEDQLTRTLLCLTYCPGGDLFELAAERRDLLTPALVQRMFAELVDAVRYLHKHWIVHRDIKLENVLVNYDAEYLKQISDPIRHPTPLITLSDLGLSRRIPQPPESCLLTTRCGSEDYAAPEILLGQPYDGRLTDGWALGVLLYALIEGRLPFDAPPGKPDRSRNTHRIARCDWIWCKYGTDKGEWDPQRGADFEGARPCVEGLLKKVRMGRKPLEEIEVMFWVQNGIQVPGGLQMRTEDTDDFE